MDTSNPDLTKKVLSALSPNDIKSEDEIDKKLSIVTRKYPSFGKRQEEERTKAIEQGKKSIEKGLKKKGVDVSKLPKRGLFDRFRRKQSKATIKNGKPKRGMFDMFRRTQNPAPINTRTSTQKDLKVNQQHLENYKRKKSKAPPPIQAPGVQPTKRTFTRKKQSITRNPEVV